MKDVKAYFMGEMYWNQPYHKGMFATFLNNHDSTKKGNIMMKTDVLTDFASWIMLPNISPMELPAKPIK
jgi:hypothetical protein